MFCFLTFFIFATCRLFYYGVTGQEDAMPSEVVTAPVNLNYGEGGCGIFHAIAGFFGQIDGENYPVYHLNETAKKLASEGFNITVERMFHDVIEKFRYTNGTFTGNMAFSGFNDLLPVGGRPASRVRAYYMAQLGERTSDGIRWLCDGALINRRWVLSAAHCFTDPFAEPNIVRLGDYDLNELVEGVDGIVDFPINDVIFHPDFKFGERYHDLVLIFLPGDYPYFSSLIKPICLPWGDSESNIINLVGSQVVLTGWGATVYGGEKTTLLQEVDLRVFDPSVCNSSYSNLPSFRKKFPRGMNAENILCAGWEEGGKDACGGDSGGPVAYQKSAEFISKIFLAGIVSGGYGCGLENYPGLYIPIYKPFYLKWIKEVAFEGPKISTVSKEVAAPNDLESEFPCGYNDFLPKFSSTIGEENVPLYYLNATAELLSAEGFDITVVEEVGDAIFNFTYTNETFTGSLSFDSLEGSTADSRPGRLDIRIRAYYMALIGKISGNDIRWLCDGVLINKNWVLSAAHCFVDQNLQPNVIRIGEYDLSVPTETDRRAFGKFVHDYPIRSVIFHPKFKFEERYHDLALIKLPRKYPTYTNEINPICLPWDSETSRDLVGTRGVMTGWGPTVEGGEKSTILREANLTVLAPSECASQSPNFGKWYPRGTSSDTLCAKLDGGEQNTCVGDSGSPLTYQMEDGTMFLAGIASGDKCGLFTPVNRREYLQWIKETAFKEFI